MPSTHQSPAIREIGGILGPVPEPDHLHGVVHGRDDGWAGPAAIIGVQDAAGSTGDPENDHRPGKRWSGPTPWPDR